MLPVMMDEARFTACHSPSHSRTARTSFSSPQSSGFDVMHSVSSSNFCTSHQHDCHAPENTRTCRAAAGSDGFEGCRASVCSSQGLAANSSCVSQ